MGPYGPIINIEGFTLNDNGVENIQGDGSN